MESQWCKLIPHIHQLGPRILLQAPQTLTRPYTNTFGCPILTPPSITPLWPRPPTVRLLVPWSKTLKWYHWITKVRQLAQFIHTALLFSQTTPCTVPSPGPSAPHLPRELLVSSGLLYTPPYPTHLCFPSGLAPVRQAHTAEVFLGISAPRLLLSASCHLYPNFSSSPAETPITKRIILSSEWNKFDC